MIATDPRDVALQSLTPTVMVPRFGAFERLRRPGHRFLAAQDGLWVEACRPGIYSLQVLALQDQVAMPYGKVTACIELACGQLPMPMIHEFVAYARQHMPNEVAMAFIWDDEKQTIESSILEPLASSPGHIRYQRPDLQAGQHVIADIHSHGTAGAFFSKTDNQDDVGDLKVAIVVGNLNLSQPTIKARMCTMGHYRPLSISL